MTAPLCKDCAHFVPSLYEHEPNSDYWFKVKIIGAKCGYKSLPDVVYGTELGLYRPPQLNDTAAHMRADGPCGMDGKFFEAKETKL